MFFMVGAAFLVLLSFMLFMLWGHEKLSLKRFIPRALVKEYWDGDERRSDLRFEDDLEIEYNVKKKSGLKSGSLLLNAIGVGKSLNISSGGMKLMLDEKLPNGAIMALKIYTPEDKKTIEVEAEVVWTKEVEGMDPSGKRFFHSGIKFTGIREPSGIHLRQYIAFLGSKK